MRGKFLCFFLAASFFFLFLPLSAHASWYIRVVAQNDSFPAQIEKIWIRNAVLSICPDQEDALFQSLPQIETIANSIAPCRLEIRRWAPDQKTPPAPTVYITIGSGGGRNWWGVLYEDSLLMAQADKSEETRILFVWPWFARLRNWLGL